MRSRVSPVLLANRDEIVGEAISEGKVIDADIVVVLDATF